MKLHILYISSVSVAMEYAWQWSTGLKIIAMFLHIKQNALWSVIQSYLHTFKMEGIHILINHLNAQNNFHYCMRWISYLAVSLCSNTYRTCINRTNRCSFDFHTWVSHETDAEVIVTLLGHVSKTLVWRCTALWKKWIGYFWLGEDKRISFIYSMIS